LDQGQPAGRQDPQLKPGSRRIGKGGRGPLFPLSASPGGVFLGTILARRRNDRQGGAMDVARMQAKLGPQWQDWLAENLARGCRAEDLSKVMVDNDFDPVF